MWGIVPAAGIGSRIQPLAFSKELLPVGCHRDGNQERPRAISEYLLERMAAGGASKICFVISPGKSDIVEYYSDKTLGTDTGANINVDICYTVQPRPVGLCDAIFRAVPFITPEEFVLVGLPDTVWFPQNGFTSLPDDDLSFLLFPVEHPEFFDAVVTDNSGSVLDIQVKQPHPATSWVWGAFKLSGFTLRALHELWLRRDRKDEFFGTLVNAYISEGGNAKGIRAGEAYFDVGTLRGYREAIRILSHDSSYTGQKAS